MEMDTTDFDEILFQPGDQPGLKIQYNDDTYLVESEILEETDDPEEISEILENRYDLQVDNVQEFSAYGDDWALYILEDNNLYQDLT